MNRELWEDWLNYDARADLKAFQTVPTAKWLEMGEQRALETFRTAAERVSAYREFLADRGIHPERVRTMDDFRQLPLTDKSSYFGTYSLSEVALDGTLHGAATIHTGSGSSGGLSYWPKSAPQDINSYKGVELLYVGHFDVDVKPTLFINCLAMGTWPAGEIMHAACKAMGDKGLPISVISPGLDADRFLAILVDLGKAFEQVIVGAYPSFLRNLVDAGLQQGVDFRRFNMKVLTGGERFSEEWRRYVTAKLGLEDPRRDIASCLGISEIGIIGFTTPLTEFLRMYLYDDSELGCRLFGDGPLPTLIQYVPPARYAEMVDGEIIVTCGGTIPIVRYNTMDIGALTTPGELLAAVPDSFVESYDALNEPYGIPNLPVLAVQGRADALTLLAVNIYHNQLCFALEAPELSQYVTGRFMAEEIETEEARGHLRLWVELRPSVDRQQDIRDQVQRQIAQGIAKMNDQYAAALNALGEDVFPLVELVQHSSGAFPLPSGKGSAIRRRLSNQPGGTS
jgi:phenylacetate-CoA ligase